MSNMKTNMPRIFDWLAVAAVAAAVMTTWLTVGMADTSPTGTPPEASAVRVEIQRYMGYEILPVRYLSLPYDLTVNANEQIPLLDVGFLLLIFVPIVVMLGLRKWPVLRWAVLLSCLLLLVISTSNGFIFNTNLEKVRPVKEVLDSYLGSTAFADAPAGVVTAFFYQTFLPIGKGIESVLSRVTGDRDAVTYPLLLLFFVLFFYVARLRFKGQEPWAQGLMAFLFVYTFLWLILSSGIVWYGFLVFPLFTVLVFWAMDQQRLAGGWAAKTSLYGFYALLAVTVCMGFAQRFSNININIVNTDKMAGKRLFDPAYVKYLTGELDAAGVTEAFYPGTSKAFEEINRETNSLIYSVGTRFNFFIREDDKRIFKDNQLDFFHLLQANHPYKERITRMLKNSGFRYIMVDFNTPTGDKTPEQSLVEKYTKFMLLLYENPGLELVATNRVLKETIQGKEQYKYGVFGEVKDYGSYAIFRIK